MSHELELVLDAQATLGEGPSWDDEHQVLYWVDIAGHKIHIYDPKTNSDKVIQTDQPVGAVVPSKSGGLTVAAEHGFYTIHPDKEQWTPIADPEQHLPENRFNDGKCDAKGRFWAGTMHNGGKENEGALYCLHTDFSVRKVLEPVSISNGIAWAADNETMYYIDTPTRQVVAFDFDLDTGTIRHKRVVVTIPAEQGLPDGMTIDAEGMIWVAHWGGYQVSRWNPKTGEQIQSIQVPVAKVTSCAFGGEKLDELYITTARIDLTPQELAEQPHAGGLFRIKTNVKGGRTYKFHG